MSEVNTALLATLLSLAAFVLGVWVALKVTSRRAPQHSWSWQQIRWPGYVAIAAIAVPASAGAQQIIWAAGLGVCVVAAMWDLDKGVIPNELLWPLGALTVLAIAIEPAGMWVLLLTGVLMLAFIPFGVGAGDVKFLTLLSPVVYAGTTIGLTELAGTFALLFMAVAFTLALAGSDLRAGWRDVRMAPGILAAAAILPAAWSHGVWVLSQSVATAQPVFSL